MIITKKTNHAPSKQEILTKNKNVVINRLFLMALTFEMYKKSFSIYG